MSAVLTASIRELCRADHRDDPRLIARWMANKTPAGVGAMLANPGLHLFVAEHGGQLAAVGAIFPAKREVALNYVDPAYRFAGLSRALLAAMEDALGRGEARLDSTVTAHRFYCAAGWQDADGATGHFGLPSRPMRKVLG
jgi:GNAT superfamily N-acetyltransferase